MGTTVGGWLGTGNRLSRPTSPPAQRACLALRDRNRLVCPEYGPVSCSFVPDVANCPRTWWSDGLAFCLLPAGFASLGRCERAGRR